jgi:hypothetical protein
MGERASRRRVQRGGDEVEEEKSQRMEECKRAKEETESRIRDVAANGHNGVVPPTQRNPRAARLEGGPCKNKRTPKPTARRSNDERRYGDRRSRKSGREDHPFCRKRRKGRAPSRIFGCNKVSGGVQRGFRWRRSVLMGLGGGRRLGVPPCRRRRGDLLSLLG